ncbi:MAG TPA: hypothetical protein VKK79_00555 [Candidatus Lokiarchaeia archaeon]|nr:hypothetical protein [Candidatus Lokiarchaeia archaeon]
MTPSPSNDDEKKLDSKKKKNVDVFWMDDDEEIAEFKQQETEEQAKSQWQDIQDPNDVIAQLTSGMFGIPGQPGGFPEDEADWEQAFKEFEREMRRVSGQGSFAERASMRALQLLMVDQQKGGARGRISRFFTGILEKVFGALDRTRAPKMKPQKAQKSQRKKGK